MREGEGRDERGEERDCDNCSSIFSPSVTESLEAVEISDKGFYDWAVGSWT